MWTNRFFAVTVRIQSERGHLVPAIAAGAAIAFRTWVEDRTLHAELPGYVEYSARVHYRLVPGIW